MDDPQAAPETLYVSRMENPGPCKAGRSDARRGNHGEIGRYTERRQGETPRRTERRRGE